MRRILDRNYQRAEQILKENIDKLHAMASALIKYETIDKLQIEDVMVGRDIRDPEHWVDMQKDSRANQEKNAAAANPQQPNIPSAKPQTE